MPSANNTILLKGDLGRRREEFRASGVCKPGHLLSLDSNNKVLKHASAGGVSMKMFAVEDSLQANIITDEYAIGDLVFCHYARPGDKINARLPANAAAVVIGDYLVSDGTGCLIGGVAQGQTQLFRNVAASAAVTNTTTETAFDQSYTFPANTLKVGDVIRIVAQGIATSTNSTDTLNIKLKIGSTVIAATGAVDVANNDIFYIDATLIVRTIGASGTFVASGTHSLGASGTVTAKSFFLASTTIDTTATQLVTVTATWSVASASNSVRLDMLGIEKDNSAAIASGAAVGVAAEAVDNSAVAAEAFCAAWIV